MKIITTSLLFFVASFFIYSQENKIFLEDFNYLHELVKANHPFAYINQTYFDSIAITYRKQVLQCKDVESFSSIAQSYMNHLKDGHSKIRNSYNSRAKGRYPVRFSFKEERLYLKNYSDVIDEKYIGQQVIAINEVPIVKILDKAKGVIPFENEIYFKKELAYSLSKIHFLQLLDIDSTNYLSISIKTDNAKIEIESDSMNKLYKFVLPDGEKIIKKSKQTFHEPINHPISGYNNKLFEYELLEEYNTCYFKYNECYDKQYLRANKKKYKPYLLWSFAWNIRGGDFSRFTNKMFDDIYKNNIENLIVDIRRNRGGSDILGHQFLEYIADIDTLKRYKTNFLISSLLKENHPEYFDSFKEEYLKQNHTDSIILPIYLSQDHPMMKSGLPSDMFRNKKSDYYQDEPFSKFKGKIYLLIGSETFSSAAILATEMFDNKLAITIGSPISMKPSHYGEVLSFELPNTGLKGGLSCKKFVRPEQNNDPAETITPNYIITTSIAEKYKGNDNELEFVLDSLIINNK